MESKRLHFLMPLLGLGIIIAIIAAGVFTLNYLNLERKERVRATYERETNEWLDKNQEVLTQIFAQAQQDFLACGANCYSTVSTASGQINSKLSHDLKDWSSTAFLLISPKENIIFNMNLDGNLNSYSLDYEERVRDLLEGRVAELPWENYTWQFRDKEVIFPVRNKEGKIIGAIMRGVIEEKSF